MKYLKNLWRFSKIRFWIINLKWNYSFWLYAKPVYKQIAYKTKKEELDMDENLNFVDERMKFKTHIKQQKRFVGYMFNNNIYLDNPGPQGIDQQTKQKWKEKRWI